MGRLMVYFLLLVIIFLAGMLIGIDQERNAPKDKDDRLQIASVQSEKISSANEKKNKEELSDAQQSDYVEDMEENLHFTQKVASFLEKGVKIFYELIVNLLYEISRLFI